MHQEQFQNFTIFEDDEAASRWVANEIANLIETQSKDGQGRNKASCVLGLATGSTPKGVYAALVKLYKQRNLDFSHVVTFNLDEYYPIAPDSLQSYHRYMHQHLFHHVNIPNSNIHLLYGNCSADEIAKHCEEYEAAIQEAGGIDFLLLGIGSKGHIGFNEAELEEGASKTFSQTRTRLVTLAPTTRRMAAAEFFSRDHVPYRALSMGMATILAARRIVLVAYGEAKADAVRAAVEGPRDDPSCPASYLQGHPNSIMVVDAGAAEQLTRTRCPWVGLTPKGLLEMSLAMKMKAVCWLARRLGRPILRLTTDDYLASGLIDLLNVLHTSGTSSTLSNIGRPEPLNSVVLKTLQAKVALCPTSFHPELRSQQTIKILIFSPHPDDDVISMGGTLMSLCSHDRNEVHVAYQTNGAVAVRDEDLIDQLRFAKMVHEGNPSSKKERDLKDLDCALKDLEMKKHGPRGSPDSPLVLQYKAKVRENEAISAALACGIKGKERLHFLDLPFYKTGMIDRDPLGLEDYKRMDDVLLKVSPDIVFAAGDLSDPHGTHRTCLQAVIHAVNRRRVGKPVVYLYRGAWQEWRVEEADVLVPLSSAQLDSKVAGIWKHRSQKDPPPFPGADPREFWERARSRNEATAKDLAALGVGWWDGVEAFVKLEHSRFVG
jgi:glucosamine-6-phosphate deaminase